MKRAGIAGIFWLAVAMACAQTHPAGQAAAAERGTCAAEDPGRVAQQVIAAWIAGYNGRDAGRVAALYAPDAYYLTQHYVNGIVHGRADIQAYLQRGVDAGYHIDAIRIVHVACAADMMYAITRYESTNAGQKARGVNLVVLRRGRTGWRIVAHEAAVPDPATAVQQLGAPAQR